MCVVACLIGGAQAKAGPFELQGRIVGVHDGDTVTLLDADNRRHKIRVDGIDAPELGQAFGKAAKVRLSELVARRNVVATCSKTDRYRREVCLVQVDGVDAGGEMLRHGMAWYFRRYARELSQDRRTQYAFLEEQARITHRGLWAETASIPPWEWRASKKQEHL
ncbi:thermonuclease family protein [Inhella sp. 4Y17]|uniref:Thermonuclease family protein n=2 Tax=Inhella gelatinilytica TaxID=2795030 RepID=A0A931IW94_9BURK|nr:thermonuclease family protein [Inhella gelatinilytica]